MYVSYKFPYAFFEESLVTVISPSFPFLPWPPIPHANLSDLLSNNLDGQLPHKCILFKCYYHTRVTWGSLPHSSAVLSTSCSLVSIDDFAYIKQMPPNVLRQISIFRLFGFQYAAKAALIRSWPDCFHSLTSPWLFHPFPCPATTRTTQ